MLEKGIEYIRLLMFGNQAVGNLLHQIIDVLRRKLAISLYLVWPQQRSTTLRSGA